MRAEKTLISEAYLRRLNDSPFFIVVDYRGIKVPEFAELRARLSPAGAEVHVIKKTIFKIAAKEAGIEDLEDHYTGQLAVITGEKEMSAAAKVTQVFHAEFEKPVIRFGYIGSRRLAAEEVKRIAELPPLEQLRGSILALVAAPASGLARLLNAPAARLARVIQAHAEQGADVS